MSITFGCILLFASVTANAEEKEYPYYKLNDTIELPDGGYNLNTDNIGIKTIYVNKAMYNTDSARYGSDTASAVKKFQTDNGLPVTGEVDLATWLKMGYTEEDWYGLGTYTYPVLTTKYSSRDEIVNAMLIAAKDNADQGTIYRVGCSGPAGTYTDCSGLVFQCLYAAGINPEKNIVDHALAVYEYTSRNLEADEKLGVRVTKDELQPGDLVFYQYKGVVCHVGILAGNGKMYDSWPQIGVTYRDYTKGGNILCFKRVLPDYDEYRGEVPDNSVTGKNMSPALDSCILYDINGTEVKASESDIIILADENGTVTDISLSRDVCVSENGFALAATGNHAEWLLDNVTKGDAVSIEDYLISVCEAISEETDTVTEQTDSITEQTDADAVSSDDTFSVRDRVKEAIDSYSGPLHLFSLFN